MKWDKVRHKTFITISNIFGIEVFFTFFENAMDIRVLVIK